MENSTDGVVTPTSPIAQYYATRAKRLALNKEAAMLEVQEAKLKHEIVKNWDTLKAPQGYRVTRDVVETPFVEDWPMFLQWVRDTNSVDCLQKRITESAIKARLEDGDVPGVTTVPKTNLTIEFTPTE